MARLFVGQAAGELSADAGVGDTGLASEAFELLPVVADPDFIEITVDCDGLLGEPATVRVLAHAEASTSVTVEPLPRSFKKGMDWVAGFTEEFIQELTGTSGGGGGGGGGGTGTGDVATVMIAQSGNTGWRMSPQVYRDAANYVCDAVDDQVEFQQAIDAAVAAGFSQINIYLAPGAYTFTAPVTGSLYLRIFQPQADWVYYDTPGTWDSYINNEHAGPAFSGFRHIECDGICLDMGEFGWFADRVQNTYYGQYSFKRCELGHWWDTSPSWLTGNFDLKVERCYVYSYSSNATFLVQQNYPLGEITDCYIDVDVDLPTSPEQWLQGGMIRFEPPRVDWDDTDHYSAFEFRNNLVDYADRAVITTSGFMSRLRIEGNWMQTSATNNHAYSFEFNDSSFIQVLNNNMETGGVRMSGCRDVTISGNTFRTSDQNAIVLMDTSQSEVVGNRIIDPSYEFPLTYSGILLDGTSSENFIADNRIMLRLLDPTADPATGPLHGIRINASTCENNRLRDNWLHDGVDVSDAGTGTVMGGTATPSTVAELADALVELGIIASHTIT